MIQQELGGNDKCNKCPTPQVNCWCNELCGNETHSHGHKKCEEKDIDTLTGPMGNPKGFSPRAHVKVTSKEVNQCRKIDRGGNETNRKVFKQNIKRGSQKLLGHPLTLKAHLHDKHPHPTCIIEKKKMKKKKPNGMSKTLIPFKRQQKSTRRENS